MKVLTALGQEDPIGLFPFLDNRFVNDTDCFSWLPDTAPPLHSVPEGFEDHFRPFVQTCFDDRKKFLVRGQANGTGNVAEHRSLHQPHIDDMKSDELRIKFFGDIMP